jgi:methyl-accepting chemotaxis protein
MFLDNAKISRKIMGLSFGILLLFSAIFGFVAYSGLKNQGNKAQESYVSFANEDMKNYRTKLFDNSKTRLKDLTVSVTSLIEDLNQKVIAGKMPLDLAQNLAKSQIEVMRYDEGKGYFWINNNDPVNPIMIMHPIAKDLNGKDIGQYTKDGVVVKADSTDTPMFRQMVLVCQSSSSSDGFVGYQWPSPVDKSQWLPKLSYVSLFKPWGWIVGTGVYIDEIDTEMAKKQEESGKMAFSFKDQSSKQTSRAIYTMVVALIVLVGIGIVAILFVSGNITKPLKRLQNTAEAISKGDLNQDTDFRRKDEIGDLANSFGRMLDGLKEKTKAAEEIAKGNLSLKINVASDHDVLGLAMVNMVQSLSNVTSDLAMLTKSSLDGRLDVRAEAAKHEGDYGKIISGINDLLDAVVTPLNEAAAVLKAAADKNLTPRVKGDYKGRLAEFKDDINSTLETLDDALAQVTEAVAQVSSASSQIAVGSQSLAEGASEQASALEEVSSSLEELASMTRQNADNAKQAQALSGSARDSAYKGGDSMKKMTDAIGRIKESSDQTAKIVKTIDEIAFQTNLLALNAAVEAARAGEAGKGFAVVAEEVRSLAQRSADAAKNTAQMIEGAVKNAEGGVRISDEMAAVLNEIVEKSSKVGDLVSEISAAAVEQSQGIDQITTAVSQMDQVTQTNASSSEESASAAEELSSQAEELQAMVGTFRLSDSMSRMPAANTARGYGFAKPKHKEETLRARAEEPAVETVKRPSLKSKLAKGTE